MQHITSPIWLSGLSIRYSVTSRRFATRSIACCLTICRASDSPSSFFRLHRIQPCNTFSGAESTRREWGRGGPMPVIMRGLRRFDQGGDYCTSSKPQLTLPEPPDCLIWCEYYVERYRGVVIDPDGLYRFHMLPSVTKTADRVRKSSIGRHLCWHATSRLKRSRLK